MLSFFRKNSNLHILQKNNRPERWIVSLTVCKKLEDTTINSTVENQPILRAGTSSDHQSLTSVSLNEPIDHQRNQNMNNVFNNKRHFPGETLESERKKTKLEEYLKLDNNDKFDEDYHFAMSILPFLRKMEEVNKLKARTEIIEIIGRELENLDQ